MKYQFLCSNHALNTTTPDVLVQVQFQAVSPLIGNMNMTLPADEAAQFLLGTKYEFSPGAVANEVKG